MEIWVIAMICLPVLCATGNLRRALKVCGISTGVFISYFLISLGLTLLPDVYVFDTGISLSGAFLCLSAVVYIIVKKQLDYRFFIASALVLLINAAEFVVSNSYGISYLKYVTISLMVIASVLIYREKAALYMPLLALMFSVSGFVIALALGLGHNYMLFNIHEMLLLSLPGCLFFSYAFKRYTGKHLRKAA